ANARQSVDLAMGSGRVRSTLSPQPRVRPGERIEVVLALEPFVASGNPSDFDPRGWARLKGYTCRGAARSAHGVIGGDGSRRWHGLRQRAYDALERLDEPARSVVRALALGARLEMPPALRDRWSRAGIAHLLAISGLHITLVAGSAYLAVKGAAFALARWGRSVDRWPLWASGVATAVAMLYCAWVGAPMSARRATWMVAALTAARWDGGRLAPIDALALVLMVLTAVDDGAVYDVGLWLSVVAVAALIARRGGRAEAMIAPALATAPLTALAFRSIAWLSPLANTLAIPLAAIALTPLALLVSVLPEFSLLDSAVTLSVGGFDAFAAFLAQWDSACGRIPIGLALVGTAAATASAWMSGWPRWALRGAVVAALAWCAMPAAPSGQLEITFIAVGQGDASLLRFPNGTSWLIDGGGRVGPGRFDPGAQHVVPAILDAGLRRIDVIVATHGDADHIRGLHAVLDRFPVGAVLWNGRSNPGMSRVLEHARRKGAAVVAVRSEVRWVGTSRVELRVYGDAESDNDASVVTVIQHGGRRLVWPGDIGSSAEGVHRHWVGTTDVVVAAHHGSASSSSAQWLDALTPRHAVISAGRKNRYGMPHSAALERLRESGARIWRMDRRGQVQCRTDGMELSIGY
ncbi:MAG: ComEC/Rec2 family competence protein, partial [Myxococcota bacterium]